MTQRPYSSLQRPLPKSRFLAERLLHFLNALGRDIEIVIRPKPRHRESAKIQVTTA